jgi:hypothetical protein
VGALRQRNGRQRVRDPAHHRLAVTPRVACFTALLLVFAAVTTAGVLCVVCSGIGAEAIPIPTAQSKPVLKVATGEAAIANPQKLSGNSEDSLFVWKDPTWNGGNPVTYIGIADGVGSWAKFGACVFRLPHHGCEND